MTYIRSQRAIRNLGGFAGGSSRLTRPPAVLSPPDIRPRRGRCPQFAGTDDISSVGVALSNDGVLYTGSGTDTLGTYAFPDAETLVNEYELEVDLNFASSPWDFGTVSLVFSGGMTCTDVDDYLYIWVSNDTNVGQQVIARIDRSNPTAPMTVLYNPGATPDEYSYFRSTDLTWHPEDSDHLYAIQVNTDPDFPVNNTVGRADLFKVNLATGVRTTLLDLPSIAPVEAIIDNLDPYRMQHWDRGVVLPLPLSAGVDAETGVWDVNFMAWDVVAGSYGVWGISDVTPFGWGVTPHTGAAGRGTIIGRTITNFITLEPGAPITPLDIYDGGGIAPGSSDCAFIGPDAPDDYGSPLWWFGYPDGRSSYVTELGRYWLLEEV